MSKVLFLVNHNITICSLRMELVQELVKNGFEVVVSSPFDESSDKLRKEGCELRDIKLSRHGMNPVKEIALIFKYIKLLRDVKPDAVLSYTIKPNIYGGIACSLTNTPYIVNITGLGTAVENGGIIQKVLCSLYKVALKKAKTIFLQNEQNAAFFEDKKLYKEKHKIIPGSGVNLEKFSPMDYPKESENVKFLMIARVMKDKGADEFIEAASIIKTKHPDVEFHMCGLCEEEYKQKLNEVKDKGIITYHGMVEDVREYIGTSHCTILPSYHEGMPNALLESAACARPVIASDIPACKATFDEGVTGISCQVKSSRALAEAIERFLDLPYEEKVKMGLKGREKMENSFDRQIVVKAYMKEINSIINK